MKKKILIIFLIIILSFGLGITIHTIQVNRQYTTFIGTVDYIEKDNVFIIPEDEFLNNNYKHLYFKIVENSETTWSSGDKLEIRFQKDSINEDGFIKNPTLNYLGKSRLFNNKYGVPVSNSENLGGNYVFKSFYDYNTSLNFKNFTQKDNFYLKKIISYQEYLDYKEIIPEIRTLTEDDFINYYLIILISNNTENVYTLEGPDENTTSLTLNIFKHKSLSKPLSETEPTYSGISIVVPNRCDFDIENINIVTKETSN